MPNNNALGYLVFTKLKGKIRYLFRKPIRAILSVLGIIILGFLMFNILTRDAMPLEGEAIRYYFMLILALFPALLIFIFVFNKKTALLYLNDANFLFTGPFNDKQIKFYIFMLSIEQMVTIGLMFVLYIIVFLNYLVFTPALVYQGLLITLVSVYVTLMYTNYYYIYDASNEINSLRKKWLPILMAVVVIVVALIANINQGDYALFSMLDRTVLHPLFEFVPFLGWGVAIQNGHYLVGFLPPLILAFLHTWLFFRYQGDYYEKAMEDANMLSLLQKKAGKMGNSQEAIDSNKDAKKLTKLKHFNFLPGGWALLSRQILQLIKTKQLLEVGQITMLAIYTIIAIGSQDATFYQVMLLVSVVFVTNTESLENELKRHYIYLIPDHNFKKLMAAQAITFIRTFMYSLVSFVILIIFFKEPVVAALMFALNLCVITLLYQAIQTLVLRFLGLTKNMILSMFLKITIYFVVMIPNGLVISFLVLFLGYPLESILWIPLVLNAVLALLILYGARGVVDGAGIAD